MELLEGEGFDQRLAREGCISAGEAATWIAFIARGLDVAHRRGFVHRDIKPGNLFFALDARGDVTPKILDFGVAKVTGAGDGGDMVKTTTGAVLGSPLYMSPEQALGQEAIDARSDIWSLGVILYELLTGKPPFDAANYNALMVAILTKPHAQLRDVAPGVPAALSDAVNDALAKDRSQRIPTARDFADRLEAIAMTLPWTPPSVAGSHGVTNSIPQGSSTMRRAWMTGSAKPIVRTTRPAALLMTAGALFLGTLALAPLRAERVSVARRSAVLLAISVVRVDSALDALRAAELSPSAFPPPAITEVVSTPVGKPIPARPPMKTKPSANKRPRDDSHGGVEGSGF
jgi:serine/threonine-protein kinase